MTKLVIPVEFFKALEGQPTIFRIMWISWLANPEQLALPTFSDNIRYSNVPQEKIKECYAVGMAYLGAFFVESEAASRGSGKVKRISTPRLRVDNTRVINEILDYLNTKAGTSYRSNTKQTVDYINGRLMDGFVTEDFFKVIDKKVKDWKGTAQEIYLRPITLFSPSKFENYLNQPVYGNHPAEQPSNASKVRSAVDEAKQRVSASIRSN